jgi:hypothetical protein
LTVKPTNHEDAHRPLEKSHNLAASLSHVETRQVRNDYMLRWDGKFYRSSARRSRADCGKLMCGWSSGWTDRWRRAMASGIYR